MKKVIVEGFELKEKTYKDMIVAFICIEQPVKRSQMYHLGDERRIRKVINELIIEGIVKSRRCECGTTDMIELI